MKSTETTLNDLDVKYVENPPDGEYDATITGIYPSEMDKYGPCVECHLQVLARDGELIHEGSMLMGVSLSPRSKAGALVKTVLGRLPKEASETLRTHLFNVKTLAELDKLLRGVPCRVELTEVDGWTRISPEGWDA